jgi:hypothetical protein
VPTAHVPLPAASTTDRAAVATAIERFELGDHGERGGARIAASAGVG